MNLTELIAAIGLDKKEIIATIIKPIRNGDIYKSGRMVGIKAGIQNSSRGWKKKPRVQVVYNIFDYGKSEHSDWVDFDNCTFEIVQKQSHEDY